MSFSKYFYKIYKPQTNERKKWTYMVIAEEKISEYQIESLSSIIWELQTYSLVQMSSCDK